MHDLIDKLRKRRVWLKLTQTEAGELCDPKISQISISNIEQGKQIPSLALFCRYAAALGLDVRLIRKRFISPPPA